MSSDKREVSFEQDLPLGQCIDYLESIVEAMRAGDLKLAYDGKNLFLSPSQEIHTEIKAKQKPKSSSLTVELSWDRHKEPDTPKALKVRSIETKIDPMVVEEEPSEQRRALNSQSRPQPLAAAAGSELQPQTGLASKDTALQTPALERCSHLSVVEPEPYADLTGSGAETKDLKQQPKDQSATVYVLDSAQVDGPEAQPGNEDGSAAATGATPDTDSLPNRRGRSSGFHTAGAAREAKTEKTKQHDDDIAVGEVVSAGRKPRPAAETEASAASTLAGPNAKTTPLFDSPGEHEGSETAGTAMNADDESGDTGSKSSCTSPELRGLLATYPYRELSELAHIVELQDREQLSKDELVTELASRYPATELFTYQRLYDRAKELGVAGRSSMSKEELIQVLQEVEPNRAAQC